MGIFFTFKYLFAIIFLLLSSFHILAQNDNPAIATLADVEGSVQVFKKSSKSRTGVHGMLLFEGNKLLTHNKSKTTVKYRDGSIIRLFQNSTLTLNSSEEQPTNERTFKFQLALKSGSLRGRFVKGLQRTMIRTPTAIIGIKGTSFRISENNNLATVSLTEGKLEISNITSKTILKPGQWIHSFNRTTELKENVSQIPNLLYMKTDKYELDFGNGESKQLDFNLQLQESISGTALNRSGMVVLESDYKNIKLPKPFLLNERGFARILVDIDPPNPKNTKFNGLVTIRAFMDGENFDDVSEGLIVLKFINSNNKRVLLLDPNKGAIMQEE